MRSRLQNIIIVLTLVATLVGSFFPIVAGAATVTVKQAGYILLKLPWGIQKVDEWTLGVPSWSAPEILDYGDFGRVFGDLSEATGVPGDRQERAFFLTRWKAVFKNIVSGQTKTFDSYDVYQLLEFDIYPEVYYSTVEETTYPDGSKVIIEALTFDFSNPIFGKDFKLEDLTNRRGMGLITEKSQAKELTNYANGSWAFVEKRIDEFTKEKVIMLYNIDDEKKPALRARDIILLSGGKVESTVASWTGDPAAPGNGTATFLITPWPYIDRAEADGGRATVQFRAWGFSNELATLHPRIWLTTTPDDPEAGKIASHDYGDQPGPEFKGTFQADLPKDVDLSNVWAVVEDGFGRTAKKPLVEKPEAWTYSWLADDEFEYVKGQNWFFRSDLMLLYKDGPLFDVKNPEKYVNDRFVYEYSVDGGPWQTLLVTDDLTRAFVGGRPRTSAIISREALNVQIAKSLQDGRDHQIRFKVKAAPGNVGVYKFVTAKNPTPADEAIVTIKIHAREAVKGGDRGLWRLRWSTREVPNEVQSAEFFEAPLWISNDGDRGGTAQVKVIFTANAIIKREYIGELNPPPPDYFNFPLVGYVERPITLGPHDAEEWRIKGKGEPNPSKDPIVRYQLINYYGPVKTRHYVDHLLIPGVDLEEVVSNGGVFYLPLMAGNPIAKIKGYYKGYPIWGFYNNNVRIDATADEPSLFYPDNLPQTIYVNVIGPDGGYVVPRPKVRLVH